MVPVIIEGTKQKPKCWGVFGRDVDDADGALFLSKYNRELEEYCLDVDGVDYYAAGGKHNRGSASIHLSCEKYEYQEMFIDLDAASAGDELNKGFA